MSPPPIDSLAFAARRRNAVLRLALMALICVLLLTIAGWRWAPLWWAAYAGLQAALFREDRRQAWGGPTFYLLCFLNYCVAGLPAWFLWSLGGELAAVAATMFLCGMMAHVAVSSRRFQGLFWSSAPLVAYFILSPLLAGDHWSASGAAMAVCGALLLVYFIMLWLGQRAVVRSLEDSRTRAEAASQAKGDFLATMSHEIRTPLNAVLGAAVLLQRTKLTAEQAEHVAMLRDGGGVLTQILNDVLDLSKIEAGKLAIEPAYTDIYSLVRRSAGFWTPAATDAGLDLSVDIDPVAARHVTVDATRVGQIIANLLSNAIKFTGKGSVRVSLTSEPAGPDRATLFLSVADTGMGMSPETIGRLFTAFEQADGSITRRFGGTGLGLSIAQRLAHMMDGEITVSSEPGRGSTFQLRLPVALAQQPELVIDDDEAILAPPPRGLRILLAEDNPSNQRIIELFLSTLHPDLTIVGDGAAAVEALSTTRFDVVLMDMQMPVMDGLEATRRVRAGGGPNAEAPILALTANVMDTHQEACRQAGMDGHIAKPIDARVLLTSVLTARRLGKNNAAAA